MNASLDGMVHGAPRIVLHLEGALIFGTACSAYAWGGHSWWLFGALFFVPDFSMLAYLINPSLNNPDDPCPYCNQVAHPLSAHGVNIDAAHYTQRIHRRRHSLEPPSARMTSPVTQRASSPARNTITPAISSGVATRLIAWIPRVNS